MLMRIADHIDNSSGPEVKEWFLNNKEEVLLMLEEHKSKTEHIKTREQTGY